jgi:phosphoglucosamine mutase
VGRYIEFCKSTIPSRIDFKGLKIVIDCANGSTYHIAPYVFEEIGAEVVAIGVEPDGLNINDGVGATKPEKLSRVVLEERADFGIALDGDGDRLIMVDQRGEIVDGDELLYIIAKSRIETGELRGPVIGTLMSNLGLEHALARLGVGLQRAAVGDRYVVEMMLRHDSTLGGESSGHIICRDRITTGDGIVSALQVMEAMHKSGLGLHELKKGMAKYPQCLVNVRVGARIDVDEFEPIQRVKNEILKELNGSGRILLRPSGTEPLIRIMVEGQDSQQVKALADRLAGAVSSVLS